MSSAVFASCGECSEKLSKTDCGCDKKPACGCEQKKDDCGCNKKSDCTSETIQCDERLNRAERTKCDKCSIEDDEYCVYNQCFFDKQFRKMKKELCLSKKQETCIDNIYRNFKTEMEGRHAKYRVEKNKLLDMIECNNDCWKDQRNVLKEMKKETKERCKDFRDEIKEQLCKNQYSDFRKFTRCEKRKMKKLVKYAAVYKLPCTDCCK